MVLETPEERVNLLKAGQTGQQIEKQFVQLNNFKIVDGNLLQTQED